MPAEEQQIRLLAICMVKGVDWHLIAREAQRPGGLDRLEAAEVTEQSSEALRSREALRQAMPVVGKWEEMARRAVGQAEDAGATLHTVLDKSYPTNLRLVFNLPPFLFVQGSLAAEDLRSVAVVGTRTASTNGIRRASNMARLLVERGVTVVSGMARGIDTAAHSAVLESSGRTIAVVGTGITRCYPPENEALRDRIAETGAVVSQFWPDAPPSKISFPRRNITMSGISQGTVVIEASSTSGAKMQARFALEHGKRVFLLRSLVEAHDWAAEYATRPGAHVVENVENVVEALLPADQIRAADQQRAQLSIQFG
jgi:DNA processing protein